jgi:hypothetical protein
MKMMLFSLLALPAVLALCINQNAATTPGLHDRAAAATSVSGKATWYYDDLARGTCSFSTLTLPAGVYGAAFSGPAWDHAARCGACVRVTNAQGKSIIAMVCRCGQI